jgi:hypothetical protein
MAECAVRALTWNRTTGPRLVETAFSRSGLRPGLWSVGESLYPDDMGASSTSTTNGHLSVIFRRGMFTPRKSATCFEQSLPGVRTSVDRVDSLVCRVDVVGAHRDPLGHRPAKPCAIVICPSRSAVMVVITDELLAG